MPQLHLYTGPQLAHVIRGCALLSPSGIPEVWLDEWQDLLLEQDKLASLGPDTLAAVVSALDALNSQQAWNPSGQWADAWMSASAARLPDFRGRELRDVFLGLLGLRAAAMEAQDLASVLFAMTKMEVPFA